jgi:hypothetical protein
MDGPVIHISCRKLQFFLRVYKENNFNTKGQNIAGNPPGEFLFYASDRFSFNAGEMG